MCAEVQRVPPHQSRGHAIRHQIIQHVRHALQRRVLCLCVCA